jgi:hypothetical protein
MEIQQRRLRFHRRNIVRHQHPKPHPNLPQRRISPAPSTPPPAIAEPDPSDEKQGLPLTLEDRLEEYLKWVESWCRVQ